MVEEYNNHKDPRRKLYDPDLLGKIKRKQSFENSINKVAKTMRLEIDNLSNLCAAYGLVHKMNWRTIGVWMEHLQSTSEVNDHA